MIAVTLKQRLILMDELSTALRTGAVRQAREPDSRNAKIANEAANVAAIVIANGLTNAANIEHDKR